MEDISPKSAAVVAADSYLKGEPTNSVVLDSCAWRRSDFLSIYLHT